MRLQDLIDELVSYRDTVREHAEAVDVAIQALREVGPLLPPRSGRAREVQEPVKPARRVNPGTRKQQERSAVKRAAARELWDQGLHLAQIAQKLNVSEQSVRNYRDRDAQQGQPWPARQVSGDGLKRRCEYCERVGQGEKTCEHCGRPRPPTSPFERT